MLCSLPASVHTGCRYVQSIASLVYMQGAASRNSEHTAGMLPQQVEDWLVAYTMRDIQSQWLIVIKLEGSIEHRVACRTSICTSPYPDTYRMLPSATQIACPAAPPRALAFQGCQVYNPHTHPQAKQEREAVRSLSLIHISEPTRPY